MAEPEVHVGETEDSTGEDAEMDGGENTQEEVAENGAANGETEDINGAEEEPAIAVQTTFADYLKSPIIEILVKEGEDQTILRAHQGLLVQSPFFAEALSQFSDDATTRRVDFSTESLDAVGCFLQYVYTGEYFSQKKGDAGESVIDDDGTVLLQHANVYTLADKLGLKDLKSLAHSKVHRINSTAQGEIAYARFVYANTPRHDTTIRKPIASFWGQRSHVLRHEAEGEFKSLCLEYPEFGFDVLSFVLDSRERKGDRRVEEPKSGRKRARNVL